MKIVIINGVAEAGKNTFVHIAKKKYKDKYMIFDISSVGGAKEIMQDFFGWNETKSDNDRKCLSNLKDLMIWYDDIPFKDIIRDVGDFKKFGCDLLFIYIREPEEIQKVVDYYKHRCTTLLIQKEQEAVPDNRADQNVEDYEYDYIIENNGTIEDLTISVELFIEDIIGNE